jgi:hypothetical protein
MVVIVLGIVLASLAGILLSSTARDRAEGKQQQASIRAIYASEAAVAVGIEQLRSLLEEKISPSPTDLDTVETTTAATLGAAFPGATFPVLSVKYYDPLLNIVQDTPTVASTSLVTITSGPNKGLRAQQTPIQVLATARVNKASATVADAIRVDLIPVFQFAIFFDGDLETWIPATMTVAGRVHANGDIWLSNSAQTVTFSDTVTSARLIHSRSAFSSSIDVGTNLTLAFNLSNVLKGFPTTLPLTTDAQQKDAIVNAFGANGKVGDRSTGVEPLSVPIKLSSADSCANDAACGVGRACTKIRATDSVGVCTDKIVSRPSLCSNGNKAEFAQSLAIEIIKRPAPAYGSTTIDAPYNDDGAITDPYTADFGPRPKIDDATRDDNDWFEIEVGRSVPLIRTSVGEDDPGTTLDRMYWKADIRIIDGVWYRKGSNTPVFDPELVNYGATAPSPTDLNHQFARVLRNSWWWDAREGRVYCEGADKNCVTNGLEFHRGAQIRSSDFDMAAFMMLLENASARTALFPGGTVPSDGIILYMSETYDPTYEDANTKLPRAANVRNFLNFPIAHNHMTLAQTQTPEDKVPARIAPTKTATGATPTNAPTPHKLGFFPENIWGRNAPVGFRSLTPAYHSNGAVATPAQRPAAYAAPNTSGTTGLECQRSSALTASRIPTTRPTTLAGTTITPPCIQAGATPLGAENAVRIVRAQTVPAQGFTFVTDNRLYIHGDVNVVGSSTNATTRQDVPGKIAIMADSITLTSEKFDDRSRQNARFEGFHKRPGAYTDPTFSSTGIVPWSVASNNGDAPNLCSIGDTTALPTKVNSSLLMGDVPSCIDAGDENGNRSGGINNFPRFAESWAGVANSINGSMVGLFRSERGNARFLFVGFSGSAFPAARSGSAYGTDPGCYYTAPNRTWAFDSALLTSIDSLPPGTPRVVATDRLRWVRR